MKSPRNTFAFPATSYLKYVLFTLFIITQGCTITNIQQVEVDAAPIQQAVRINEEPNKGALFARGFLSKNNQGPLETQVAGHTDVNQNGVFEVEALDEPYRFLERSGVNVRKFRGDNFAWNVPEWQGGVELEWQAAPFLALVGGLGLSEQDDRTEIRQNAGLGLLFGSETVAARLDFGMHYYQSRYRILAVQGHEESFRSDMTRIIDLFEIEGNDPYRNASLGLTLNGRDPNRKVNYFFNYTMGRQTFYDVRDELFFIESGQQQQFDYRYAENYNAFAGGLFVNMPDNNRLVLGGRWTKYNDEMDKVSFFNLFAQYDLRLF